MRERLPGLQAREEERFAATHPGSRELAGRAHEHLLGGVPMHWMRKWPGGFPLFVREASGSRFVDVDGLEYVDFCLGDTGAMSGHAPAATLRAIEQQARRGITLMLPSADALVVGAELARRFGLPVWQFALTATDANRFVVRLARHVTGRRYVLVFNWCYHGTVDETFATLVDGEVGPRRGNLGPPVDPRETTRVVEFNDVAALERELTRGDVAVVLTEPALTNIGIVHPDPGFHATLRELTRETGTLLAIDETHTICCGAGGFTAAHGLEPDLLTIGKPIAGGVDFTGLARRTPGFSGAQLQALVNEACVDAVRRDLAEVTAECFEHAVATIAMGRARTSALVTDHDREVTAWHESGHTLAAYLQEQADDPVQVTIIPRGPAGGVTWMSGNDDQFLPRRKAHAQLVTALAGRAAEEILLDGEFTQGAAGDLQSATELATSMATRYGMTRLGYQVRRAGSAPAQDVSDVVEELLGGAHTAATKLLGEHRTFLSAVAAELLAEETLTLADVHQIATSLGVARHAHVPSPQLPGQVRAAKPVVCMEIPSEVHSEGGISEPHTEGISAAADPVGAGPQS